MSKYTSEKVGKWVWQVGVVTPYRLFLGLKKHMNLYQLIKVIYD